MTVGGGGVPWWASNVIGAEHCVTPGTLTIAASLAAIHLLSLIYHYLQKKHQDQEVCTFSFRFLGVMTLRTADFISRDRLTHSENYQLSFSRPGQGFNPTAGHSAHLNFVTHAHHTP